MTVVRSCYLHNDITKVNKQKYIHSLWKLTEENVLTGCSSTISRICELCYHIIQQWKMSQVTDIINYKVSWIALKKSGLKYRFKKLSFFIILSTEYNVKCILSRIYIEYSRWCIAPVCIEWARWNANTYKLKVRFKSNCAKSGDY